MADDETKRTIASRRHPASPTSRKVTLLASWLSCALLLLGTLLPAGPSAAQQRPRTVMEMLFGNGTQEIQPRQQTVRPPRKVRPRTVRKKRQPRSQPVSRARSSTAASSTRGTARGAVTSTTAATDGADDAAPAKTENAEKILVVGDFMADGLADGLNDTYADNGDVVVKSRVNGSSGLVRQDFYDWTSTLGPILDEEKPAVLVMMIGSNDRQPISDGSSTYTLRSDPWTREYDKRIAAVAKIAKEHGVPLVWVGMPPFRLSRMSEDMVFLNDLFRQEMMTANGEFVDVWDGFVDSNDDFAASGPGVSGQDVRLRNSDGITMTSDGDDKLAFFAEKAVGRLLKLPTADPSVLTATGTSLPGAELPALGSVANVKVSAPVGLADPALDGGDTLLGGASVAGLSPEPTPREKLVRDGERTGGVDGRADNFAWNEKTGALAPPGPPISYRGTLDLKAVRANDGIKPPDEMPGILDAIMNQWAKEDATKKGAAGDGEARQPDAAN